MQQEWLNIANEKKLEVDFYYHCAQLCDPKQVKEQTLQRSTVMRYECVGQPYQNYSIERVELISHYTYKAAGSEINVKDSKQSTAAMHAVVVAQMKFIGKRETSTSRLNVQLNEPSEHDETLIYDNEFDFEEKYFYMYGDEEFGRHTPFRAVQNKIETVVALYRRVFQATSDKTQGIENEATLNLPRIVEFLRMSTVEELEQISNQLINNANKQQSEIENQKTKQMLSSTLALAATRNTIAVLIKKIQNQEFSLYQVRI